MSSLLTPRSNAGYKKNLPFTINTRLIVQLLWYLQIFTYTLVLLVGVFSKNENYNLTSTISIQTLDTDAIDMHHVGAMQKGDVKYWKRDPNIGTEGPTKLQDVTANGETEIILSLFEIINANYPWKSIYFILTALISSVYLLLISISGVINYKLFVTNSETIFKNPSYKRLNYYSLMSICLSFTKYFVWLVLNFITLEDSQFLQTRTLLSFFLLSNLNYYLIIFKIVKKNLELFAILIRSTSFSSNGLSINKVFNSSYQYIHFYNFIRKIISPHLSYHFFLKMNYFVYSFCLLLMLNFFYNHQIAYDMTYLNLYNLLCWFMIFYDAYMEQLTFEVYGLGNNPNENIQMKVIATE